MSPAVSNKQRRFFGMMYGAKKEGKPLPSKMQKTANSMSLPTLKDFAMKRKGGY